MVHTQKLIAQRIALAVQLQRIPDTGPETFARGQKFIIPDGNVSVHRVAVNHAHQLVGIAPVLLPVAEKNIGIERRPFSKN